MNGLSLVLCIICLLGVQGAFLAPRKRLAGPPSEFELHRMPSPDVTITSERSTSEYIWFQASESSTEVYKTSFPVDGVQEFVFSFASPNSDKLTLQLQDPQGKSVTLEPIHDFMHIGEKTVPTDVFVVNNAIDGIYTLTVSSTMAFETVKQLSASVYPNAVLTIINNDNLMIQSHYSSYLIKEGQEIGILSKIVDSATGFVPSNLVISSAEMSVITPDGKDVDVPMSDNDDSLRVFNYTPSDGVYGARILASSAGQYLVQAKLEGSIDDPIAATQVKFSRSTQHVIQVSSSDLELTGFAHIKGKTNEILSVLIGVQGSASEMRAYTEVYGKDATGQIVPVCWLGGVVTIESSYIELELNVQWLQLAGVSGGLILRNTYVTDLDTTFPVSIYTNDIPIENSQTLAVPRKTNVVITQEMREGVNPLKNRANTTAGTGYIVLLPGYCSSDNPWSKSTKFTNAKYFMTGGGNWANNDFANKVLDFVNDFTSFSLLGHSQGGMISAHIRNYYYTGLDSATGGRKIQTVGTPWNGCTAAGSLANLGSVFGVGCGSNNDLSLDGAKVWITGITAATRSDVYFYTTTYQQGNFFGDSCSTAMNLVLQWPNDGTTEIKYATLTGANSQGNTQKWCHTTSMNYNPQYYDESRNQIINANAAR